MMAGPPLGALAALAARKFAARTCLAYAGRRWTFAEVDAIVDSLAVALTVHLSPGARVGMFMPNRPEIVFLQLALERAGMVRVPINSRFTAHEVGVILEDCAAEALFFDQVTADRAAEVSDRLADVWFCHVDSDDAVNGPHWSHLLSKREGPRVLADVDAGHVCSINYTSGTSGKPKGVVLTHHNWAAMYRNMLVDRDIRRDDVFAHVGPLTHSSGAYFLAWFLRGACNVIVEGGDVDAILHTIAAEKATVFTCVPTVLTRIVNHPDIDTLDLSALRAIGYGAEPIPFNTLEKALKRFGPILTQNYGLTEAMMTVTLLHPREHFGADGKPRIGCIGGPYTFVEVALRAPDGREVGPGEVGEITIRSEHMMGNYWNRPEETAKVLRNGWLWSGDLATRDAEGFITLAGRSKEMLISGGFNIYPQEVEALLTSHPAVLEAAVVGVPDEKWGEIAVAYVSTVAGAALDAGKLQAHCKPILGFRTPKIFNFVDHLPKNANSKIDKPALKAAAMREREKATHG
ncbi:MAG: long-chain fatty acid--CoA ligase [Gemmatimonadetes bacterium]|nr:long-chain fatty acid--CoA ligase [Gemmatimonadota bacterium]